MSNLAICRIYGWRYEWVDELDADVKTVLIEDLNRQSQEP